MKCPHCGQEHPDDFKVCPYTAKPIELQLQYCKNEGCDFRSPLPLTAKFCPNCGNPLGQKHVSYNFDIICEFHEGSAKVRKNGKYGLLLSSGKLMLDCRYDDVLSFSEGLAAYKDFDGSWKFINTEGTVVFALDPAYTVASYFGFKCGLCAVFKVNEDSDLKYGFIGKNGSEVIQCSFSWVSDFDELAELAVVSIDDTQCAINKFGRIVSPHYDCLHIENGWLIVHNFPFTNFVQNKGLQQKISLPKKDGKNIAVSMSEDVCAYVTDDKLVCFDLMYPNSRRTFKGDVWMFYSGFSEGLMAIKLRHGFSGFINQKCEVIIPFVYTWAHDFSEGLAAVQSSKNDMWGYINKNGEIVIDFKYEEAGYFHDGLAVVSDENHEFIINTKGEIVVG